MATAKIRTSELRSIHHMTQNALAQKAQLSKTTISNLESGHQTKIALDTIAKLCQAFNCSPAELFTLKDNEEEKVLKQQKKALEPFIGSLNYKKAFDSSELDKDLAAIIDTKKKEATKLVEKYLDQSLSYTDALSVVIMRKNRIKMIFSFDSDFDLFRGIQRVPG